MRDQKSERTIIKADSGFFVATYIEAGSGRPEAAKRKHGRIPLRFCMLSPGKSSARLMEFISSRR